MRRGEDGNAAEKLVVFLHGWSGSIDLTTAISMTTWTLKIILRVVWTELAELMLYNGRVLHVGFKQVFRHRRQFKLIDYFYNNNNNNNNNNNSVI